MRVPGRFSAVALFAGVSLLALVVFGLLDWVSSSLFLLLECLVQCLRRVFGHHTRAGEHRFRHLTRPTHGARTAKVRAGRVLPRKSLVSRSPLACDSAGESYLPRQRVLVVLR